MSDLEKTKAAFLALTPGGTFKLCNFCRTVSKDGRVGGYELSRTVSKDGRVGGYELSEYWNYFHQSISDIQPAPRPDAERVAELEREVERLKTALNEARKSFEASEGPFYEGMKRLGASAPVAEEVKPTPVRAWATKPNGIFTPTWVWTGGRMYRACDEWKTSDHSPETLIREWGADEGFHELQGPELADAVSSLASNGADLFKIEPEVKRNRYVFVVESEADLAGSIAHVVIDGGRLDGKFVPVEGCK
jgi:hypothetical protein